MENEFTNPRYPTCPRHALLNGLSTYNYSITEGQECYYCRQEYYYAERDRKAAALPQVWYLDGKTIPIGQIEGGTYDR